MSQELDYIVPVVGIGASAGGLEALQTLVANIPADSGLCYVIVQHLSPDHVSILDQLLQTHTRLDVSQIEDGDPIRADHIYLVPPGKLLSIDNEVLKLDPIDRSGGRRTPIDHFFRSLAEVRARNAYCIILSGTGSDGSQGLKAVKAAGGFAIVQESDNARFPGMPNSATATGVVDFVLRAEDIAPRLDEIVRHRNQVDLDGDREAMRKEIEQHLGEFTSLLHDDQGHDFSSYKPGTLVRRIERRMMLLRLRTVGNFLELLEENDKERALLMQDFLIGVTRFFRDAEAFDALRTKVVRPLLERDTPNLRVWVPGCSTGEEVYSIAMMFIEELEKRGETRQLQFFGTDIDSAALLHGRDGLYSQGAVEILSDEQLNRFFLPEGDHFRVSQSLREMCVFAPHNLIQDPPFSRLDLVSCRNLLIYLSNELQQKVIPRFHFSLRNGGYMFLGPSEGLAGEDEYFDCTDKVHRIFEKNEDVPVRYSPLSDPRPRKPRQPEQVIHPVQYGEALAEISRETKAEQAFLRNYAPPFALLSLSGDIVYLSEKMAQFVRPAKGIPSNEIEAFLARDLRVPVRSAIDEAKRTNKEVRVDNIVIENDSKRALYDIMVCPLAEGAGQLLLTLAEVRVQSSDDLSTSLSEQADNDRAILEREVVSLRRQLAASHREHETSSQELKSTNEELLSMNEELQSSNKELETSREELQSINEELETVNSELSENNRRLLRANSDLKNLFESTDVAVLFLDKQSCIRNFTPATTAFFGVKKRDIGRPIADLSSKINYEELAEDIETVSRDLQMVEREIAVPKSGETYALRLRPYRTTDDRLDGFVLTLFDITSQKRVEQQLARNAHDLKQQYAELETLYDTMPIGLALLDPDLRYLRINERLAEINGVSVADHIGKQQSEILPDIDRRIADDQRKVLETGEPMLAIHVEGYTPAAPETLREWEVSYHPVRSDGKTFAVGCVVREVTDERKLQRELATSAARLKLAVESNPIQLAEISDSGELCWTMGQLPGLPKQAQVGEHLDQILAEHAAEMLLSAIGDGTEELDLTLEIEGEDYTYVTCVKPVEDGDDSNTYAVAFFDISERRQMEERQQVLLDELQHRVKNTLATIGAIARFLKKDASNVEDYQKRLSNRLAAISRTHDLLTVQNWSYATVTDLVDAELAPYKRKARSNVTISGDDLLLKPKEALGVGMALHELVTNAAKYGALSVNDGKVVVETRSGIEGEYSRLVTWTETGGPPVEKPTGEGGFGRFLLEKVVARDLRGVCEMTFAKDGVTYRLELP